MKVEWVPFGEVLTRDNRVVDVDPSATYPQIGVKGFARGAFDSGELIGAETKYKTLRQVAHGQVVYPKLMAWEGAFAVIPLELEGRFVSPEFECFTLDPAKVIPEYVAHLLSWAGFVQRVRAGSSGTNVRRQRLQPADFLRLRVPIPNIVDQEQIAGSLGLIEGRMRLLTEFDEGGSLLRPMAMLPELLGDLLRSTSAPLVALGALCANRQVVIHPGEPLQGASSFVGLEHIESHSGSRVGERQLREESGRKLLFSPGQVTYGYLRPYLNKAWNADRVGLCSVEQFVLEPKAGVLPELLSIVLRSDYVWELAKSATNGLQLPRLSLRKLLAFDVPDVRVVANPDSVLAKAEAITGRLARIARLRDRREHLAASILPAARNQIFEVMR